MGIWARMFGSMEKQQPPAVGLAGLLMDEGGWYYEESQDFSDSRATVRIEQDRPGDWYVQDSFCEVSGLDDPARKEEVAEFLAGSYRWLHLERGPDVAREPATIKVFGTFEDSKEREQRVHLGFFMAEMAEELQSEDVTKLWARIRLIEFPGRGRRHKPLIRFDLMIELDEETFD